MRTVFTAGGVAVAVLAVVFVARFVPIIRSPPKTNPSSLGDAQLADLAYLRTFPRYDRSFDSRTSRGAFERFVDSIAAVDTPRSPAGFELAVARAVSLADNGHSSISATGRRRRLASDLPIRLGRFEEGFFVLQATSEWARLLGGRLDALGGVRTDAVVATLSSHYGGLPARAYYYAHLDLESPAVLHALGVTASPSTLTADLTLPDGTRLTAELDALPSHPARRRPASRSSYLYEEVERDSAESWRTLMAGRDPPLPLVDPGKRFTVRPIADGAGVYARFGANENAPGMRISSFAARVLEAIRSNRARFAVVDLRDNPGGTTALGGFVGQLLRTLPADGRVYVIVSPGTFSYGIATAALLRKQGGERTILVGEPIGDRLAFWANGGSTFRLPHSGITLRAWSGRENYADGCRKLLECFWLSPFFLRGGVGELKTDVVAPLSFEDYRNGRDTALEVVLRMEAARH